MKETELIIEVMGKGSVIPPFTARECTQTLAPISQGILRRTINGDLVCISHKGHRKFQSTIGCKDKAPPAFDGLWVGDTLKVRCIQQMTQCVPHGLEKIQLEREASSLYLYDTSKKLWPIEKKEGLWLFLSLSFPGGFITYHPCLVMIVKNYHLETDEWGLTVGWKLELEEV